MTIIKLSHVLYVASIMLILSGCVNTVTRGHLKEDEALQKIKVGTSTKDDAYKALGSPSSESTFGPNTWYYVSSIKQNRSIFAPEVVDQRVTEVAFDASGVVSSIKEYSLADSKDVQIATRTTPAEGQSLGFFEQALGNLGRFNKDNGGGISNSHGHSTTSGPGGYPGR